MLLRMHGDNTFRTRTRTRDPDTDAWRRSLGSEISDVKLSHLHLLKSSIIVITVKLNYHYNYVFFLFAYKTLRAVPEIILRGVGWATVFFRPLHPQDKHGVRAPPTPRTRKCFN